MKKIIAVLLTLAMALSLAACGSKTTEESSTTGTTETSSTETSTAEGGEVEAPAEYTLHTYSTSLGSNWNPHTWETSGDDAILSYVSTPFVTMQVLDSENGIYQWIYEMATEINDVTATHQDDLTKYGVTLLEGTTAEETTEGYVYEIKLNPNACWQDGTPINADTYIYSMKALLDPAMKNYRANLYYTGESAVAGGNAYYNAGGVGYSDNGNIGYTVADLVLGEDGAYTTPDGDPVYIAPYTELAWLSGEMLDTYVGYYGDAYFDVESYNALVALANEEGYVPLTDEALGYLVGTISAVADWGETEDDAWNYFVVAHEYPDCTYEETVGCYKVDDYTIIYVTQDLQDFNYFLTHLTSNWLVYEPYYEAGKDTTGTLVTTDYNTSMENTMSYGAYKIASLQDDKQIVYVQNANWYGYETLEDGSLYSETPYEVDGEHIQRYMTTKIIIDVMTDDAAKQAFLKGELDSWTPTAEELVTYGTSDRLYKVDETYTMSFFFCCGLDKLQAMDESKGNTNSVVLSNVNFRKAMSLAIDRAEYVTATAGYKPAYSLMNSLYHYDIYNNPESSYRSSDEAMQAICNLYEVAYGDGTPYATLKDAYQSINGYNLTQAKELFAQACQELVAEGIYTEGEDIYIRIGWMKGALSDSELKACEILNNNINAALEGSGFGKLTLEPVGNINDRYGDTAKGEYAIGYGAWGGAAFYPFTNFEVYCNTDKYAIHEAGCWDPATTFLTLTIDGEEVTMTWKDWSTSMYGSGAYTNADFATKLSITAQMEEQYLKMYYRIPLAGTTACELLSYKLDYYTEDYNIMYGFGGLELYTYNYNDAEWAEFVASENGELSYE
ncbi:MAG: hypothetical protein HUJ69_06930 [Lachnospiraceae bacterium]|nr:hypothetical protein [Lachnospiraceae bacterium]